MNKHIHKFIGVGVAQALVFTVAVIACETCGEFKVNKS